MKFSDYLFFTQRLTCQDYITLLLKQNQAAYNSYDPRNTNAKCPFHLGQITDLRQAYRTPFGDILTNDNTVWGKLKAAEPHVTLDSLLKEWRQWHVDHLQPICNYSLSTKIGKEMYNNQTEKQWVASHVAKSFVTDASVVCIPEGSSATYVGLAIGRIHRNVVVVTSNEPLLREYRENPEFAPLRSFEMQAIGGQVDEYIAHGGVYGRQCERWFEEAITDKPRATVVIMPVTGLLPGVGPYGEDEPNCSLKKLLIEVSLKVSVRWLIFVTDYTKHLPSRAKKGVYGLPVFTVQAEWQQLLTNHSTRIRIITTPHPEVRGQTRSQPFLRRASSPLTLSVEGKEYDAVASTLANQTRVGESQATSFVEAFGLCD